MAQLNNMCRIIPPLMAIGAVAMGMWFSSASTPSPSQFETEAGKISAPMTLVNFGDIDQEGGIVSDVIEITNTGDNNLIIHRVSTSCGCTTVQMDTSPLTPTETRKVTILFDPMVHPDQHGPITRVVYIQSSDTDTPEMEIDVIGNVITRQQL